MPRENKKRGRRENQKRKAHDDEHELSPKRRRTSEDDSFHPENVEVQGDAGDDFISFGFGANEDTGNTEAEAEPNGPQNQFYGLLETEEQEYYVNVNKKISANDFESDEDRDLFIQAVHRETKGKEMKVASSQSCSRYLEKVIALSAADDLASLFLAFLENLTYLVQHRFGSHCCETLFLQAAKFVDPTTNGGEQEDSLESLYLRAVEALEPNIGFLLSERFASHAIRVLLLVLSGEPLQDESTESMLASRKKEKLDVAGAKSPQDQKRKVPASFLKALQRIVDAIISNIDATYLRALATHPIGNPVLQLLLKIELTGSAKSKHKAGQSLLTKLLPDEDLEPESESGKFIVGLMYDPTGSHLIETLIQCLPGKVFKKLYKNILKDRMRNLAKNDVASFVAIKVLERLGKDDLAEACEEIINEVSGLVSRHRTGLVKVLFERCNARGVDTTRLTEAVKNAYGGDTDTLLPKMLQFYASIDDLAHHAGSQNNEKSTVSPYKADLHGSLLAQTMLLTTGACTILQETILAQPPANLLSMAKNPTASRVLQVGLTSSFSVPQFRRQLVPKFYGHMTDLATNPAGSHVADALWNGTSGLHFMKEKLAKELQSNEGVLRNSTYGRTVWRNWSMDSFTRHFREWQSLAKDQAQEPSNGQEQETKKTPIEIARERHAKKRSKAGDGEFRHN